MRLLIPGLLIAWLTSCTTTTPRPDTYDAFGGQAGIEALVDDLMIRMLEDPRINFQFAETDLARLRDKLVEQFCVETGGPCRYTGLSMQESHAGRNIDDRQFYALVEDLVDAMEARGIPVGAQNRLLKRLAPMHRDVVLGEEFAGTRPVPEAAAD